MTPAAAHPAATPATKPAAPAAAAAAADAAAPNPPRLWPVPPVPAMPPQSNPKPAAEPAAGGAAATRSRRKPAAASDLPAGALPPDPAGAQARALPPLHVPPAHEPVHQSPEPIVAEGGMTSLDQSGSLIDERRRTPAAPGRSALGPKRCRSRPKCRAGAGGTGPSQIGTGFVPGRRAWECGPRSSGRQGRGGEE